MTQAPLFLKPVFHEKIWGGRHLATDFGYQIPAGPIGECWAISGHHHGVSIVANGEFAGQDLATLYQSQPALFNYPQGDRFPLLTKILDANAKLSVQVHPGDEYARTHEGELGKTECWYVLKAQPNAYLIYGHQAKSRAELAELIDAGQWDQLLGKLPVKTGDFVYVPSGTIHALTEGIEVLETQQSSDVTYRLYDYDRKGPDGKLRELHLAPAKAVITVPFVAPQLHQTTQTVGTSTVTTLVAPPTSPYFTVQKVVVNGELPQQMGSQAFVLASVIAGYGELVVAGQTYPLAKGQHFILPHPVTDWTFRGQLTLITSVPAPDKY